MKLDIDDEFWNVLCKLNLASPLYIDVEQAYAFFSK